MSTKEQSVTLLRKNKQAQVAAFNAVGMVDVTENSRASEFAKRIKWAGGLLDICLAAQRKSDKSYWYFTKEEWDSLTYENKEKFIRRGLRVRAYGHSFVLAASDCSNADGTATFTWGPNKAVPDLNGRSCGTAYNDFAGARNSELIMAAVASGDSCPAATAAAAYRAYSTAFGDEIDDTSDWHLPGLGTLMTIYKCKAEIQAALEYFWYSGSLLSTADTGNEYWSSTVLSTNEAFRMSIHTAFLQNVAKSTKLRVRAVCEEV